MVTIGAATASALAVGLLVFHIAGNVRPRVPKPPTRKDGAIAGLDVPFVRFWATVIFVSGVTFLIVYSMTDLVVVSAIPAVVMATFPRAYFARRHAVKVAAVQAAWPDGLRDLVASIRAGSSLPTAIETLAAFGPSPLRDAFAGFDIYSRSLGVVATLDMVRHDLADPTSDRVIEVLVLAYERGGPAIPEILADLAEAATRDLWTNEQIQSEALEQKINSRIVFVLPWVVLVAMTARNGAFREFYSTSAGVLVVALGGVLSMIGIWVATRLGRQPAESRVFEGSS